MASDWRIPVLAEHEQRLADLDARTAHNKQWVRCLLKSLIGLLVLGWILNRCGVVPLPEPPLTPGADCGTCWGYTT